MPVTVYIPTPFRKLAGNQTHVKTAGETVGEVLDTLGAQFPALRQMIYDENGQIPGHINIYVNNQEIHSLQGKETPVKDGDEMAVIPAIAGGQVGALTPEQVERYSRHIIMPQVGPSGQRKLMEAKVLIIGAGGLGGPAALYLALAGVGTIGIVDFDTVDLSNLQRQVLHQNADVGKRKTVSAKETINAYNPDVDVVLHETPLTSDNAMEIIPQYDIIVNGADNFTTRYLVNDAAYFAGKTLVDASILLFDGQATVFVPGQGCYRCLFPAPPPPGMVPSCAEAGVLGALTGVMGSIQATEVIKQILGIGQSLVSRLLIVDALGMEFRVVKLRRDPKCPLCGDNPTVTELIDYEGFCGAPFPGEHVVGAQS
ncbi:MAG: molybdopterin-synthase adenylyltransferase MoeB [Chloroflexi bacterium]|nr:molybdopterin-synthase adenylyltransferase MoeB [Chloroflexota bacterium]